MQYDGGNLRMTGSIGDLNFLTRADGHDAMVAR
jgi:hypothetical protein